MLCKPWLSLSALSGVNSGDWDYFTPIEMKLFRVSDSYYTEKHGSCIVVQKRKTQFAPSD